MNKEIVLIELFSGIGGFAKGLEDAGFIIKKHYFSEIDKHAIANYKYNFPNAEYVGSVQDAIRYTYSERPDIITFGWPCQDNSIAGKRKGQRRGTRSGLLFDAGNIIFKLKPKCFIAENVKGLYSVNEGFDFYEAVDFLTYLNTDSPQYTVEMQLLNTSWFLPQIRERTYFVGHSSTGSNKRIFPIEEIDFKVKEKEILRPYFIANGTLNTSNNSNRLSFDSGTTLVKQIKPSKESGGKQPYQQNRVYDINYNSPALQSQLSNGAYLISLESIFETDKIRRLTEIECERLQGFPDNWTKFGFYDNGVNEIISRHRYKLSGNAVSTVISKAIGERLLNIEYGEYQLNHSIQNEVSEVFNEKKIEQNKITEQHNLFEV